MTLPRQRRRPALLACAAIVPMLLAGCSSDLDSRNEAAADLRAENDVPDAEELARAEQAELSSQMNAETRSEALSKFYGEDETLEEEAAPDADDGAPENGGSFDDPTSDFYDNSYAVPDTGSGGDMGGVQDANGNIERMLDDA